MLDPTQEKLLGFLAAGASQTAAALACGVSSGYVSQLLDAPEFTEALSLKKAETLQETISHDNSIFSLEKRALTAVADRLPLVRNAMEAAKIFQIINGAKRAAALNGENARTESLGAQQVTIVLPKAAAVQIAFNTTNQVTEINGRSMATLPSRALPKLSAETVAIKEKLAIADATAAADKLDTLAVKPLMTSIGGVMKVL